MRNLLLLLSFLTVLAALGQSKAEVEERIEATDFPPQARRFAENLFAKEKIHWIKEQNQAGHSYEAKARLSGVKYSLEFDENGKFEDLEFVVKSRHLAEAVLQNIEQELEDAFQRFKIKKIQEQWSGDQAHLKSSMQQQKKAAALKRRYEVEVHGKSKGDYADYEYLFDGVGNFIRRQEIQESNHDNFFY